MQRSERELMTSTPNTVAFTHANIVLEDSVLEDANLIVRDGQIEAFGPCGETPVPDDATILDADHRMYLMPGIIDTHMKRFITKAIASLLKKRAKKDF